MKRVPLFLYNLNNKQSFQNICMLSIMLLSLQCIRISGNAEVRPPNVVQRFGRTLSESPIVGLNLVGDFFIKV